MKLCSVQMRLIASEPNDDFGRSLPFRRRLQSKLGYNAVESFHENRDARGVMKPEPKYFAPTEASETRTIHVPELPQAPATVFAERRVASGDWFRRAQLESMGVGPRLSR